MMKKLAEKRRYVKPSIVQPIVQPEGKATAVSEGFNGRPSLSGPS